MSAELTAVGDDTFAAEVLDSERPVVVDFWAAWCPPCRVMEPILDELARERPDVRFVKLDADANQRTVVDRGVLSMPTLVVFRDGAEVLRLVGSRPKRRLVQELSAVIGDPVNAAVS
jgi:thioredoxin 1